MKLNSMIALCVMLFCLIALCSADNEVASFSALDQAAAGLMKKYQVPGMALAVIDNGRVVWSKGYGWADKEKRIAVTGQTRFQVASNSKTLTAWGIMRLVDLGKIELDQPVWKYIKSWQISSSKYDIQQVTIRRLLSHTAGLSLPSFSGYEPGAELPTLEQSLSGIKTGLGELKIIIKPGTKYKYSGGGYALLQLAIEQVSGQSFPLFMEDQILFPLGMKNSTYQLEPAQEANTAAGYDIWAVRLPLYQFPEKAAAGLYTTASDLAQFVIANMDTDETARGNDVLKPETLDTMFIPVKKDYGSGYIIKTLKDNTHIIYHGGTNRGWRSQFIILPERKKGIVVLTNSDNGESLYQDLISLWVKAETGFIPDVLYKAAILRIIMIVVLVIGAALLIVCTFFFFRNILKGNRIFLFSGKAGRGAAAFLLKSGIWIIAAVLWYIIFYTGIPYHGWIIASKMPYGFFHITLLFYTWCLSFIVTCFFPVKKPEEISKEV